MSVSDSKISKKEAKAAAKVAKAAAKKASQEEWARNYCEDIAELVFRRFKERRCGTVSYTPIAGAREMNISASIGVHIDRKFHKISGNTHNDHIKNLVIDKICRYLRIPDMYHDFCVGASTSLVQYEVMSKDSLSVPLNILFGCLPLIFGGIGSLYEIATGEDKDVFRFELDYYECSMFR